MTNGTNNNDTDRPAVNGTVSYLSNCESKVQHARPFVGEVA